MENRTGICFICRDELQMTSFRSPCNCINRFVHWNHLQLLCGTSFRNPAMGLNYQNCAICGTPLQVIWLSKRMTFSEFLTQTVVKPTPLVLHCIIVCCYLLSPIRDDFYDCSIGLRNRLFSSHLLTLFANILSSYRSRPIVRTVEIEPNDAFSIEY